ncbi:MAG: GAF domain-containing protein [Acidimicrobiales bacterium]
MDDGPINRFNRLSMVASALSGDVAPQEVIDIVVRQGIAGLGAIGGLLGLVQGDHLHVAGAIGYSADEARQAGAFGLDRQLPLCVAARTGEGVFLTRGGPGEEDYVDFPAKWPRSGAWAAIPLLSRGQPFGALGLSFETQRLFEASEREFFRSLADIAALRLRSWFADGSHGSSALGSSVGSVQLQQVLGVTNVEGVLVVNGHRTITNADERAAEIFGHEFEDLVGMPLELLVPERYRSAHEAALDRYLSEPGPRPLGGGMRLVGRRLDGSEVPLDVSLSPCASAAGLAVIVVVRQEGV